MSKASAGKAMIKSTAACGGHAD